MSCQPAPSPARTLSVEYILNMCVYKLLSALPRGLVSLAPDRRRSHHSTLTQAESERQRDGACGLLVCAKIKNKVCVCVVLGAWLCPCLGLCGSPNRAPVPMSSPPRLPCSPVQLCGSLSLPCECMYCVLCVYMRVCAQNCVCVCVCVFLGGVFGEVLVCSLAARDCDAHCWHGPSAHKHTHTYIHTL